MQFCSDRCINYVMPLCWVCDHITDAAVADNVYADNALEALFATMRYINWHLHFSWNFLQWWCMLPLKVLMALVGFQIWQLYKSTTSRATTLCSSKKQYTKLDFLAAATKYPDLPNFFWRRKSAGKISAAINAAEFVKFGQLLQKLRLTFSWVCHFY